MIVGVAVGNSPHRVAPIVMGTDKYVSRAFPHQALQLLQVWGERGGGAFRKDVYSIFHLHCSSSTNVH